VISGTDPLDLWHLEQTVQAEKLSARTKDPDCKQRCILSIIYPDTGYRNAFWHLDDGKESIDSHQVPAHWNPNDRPGSL
jgi:hypothetical protein